MVTTPKASGRPNASLPGQRGFTYLGLLFLVALLGVVLAAAGETWRVASQRDKEAELLFVGSQFRDAIRQYVARNAATGGYPRSLDDLLRDPHQIGMQRYLRKIYVDPVTGSREWGLVKTPQGGIMGVYSVSDRQPLKTRNFAPADREFTGKKKYSDWKFVFGAPPVDPAAPRRGGAAQSADASASTPPSPGVLSPTPPPIDPTSTMPSPAAPPPMNFPPATPPGAPPVAAPPIVAPPAAGPETPQAAPPAAPEGGAPASEEATGESPDGTASPSPPVAPAPKPAAGPARGQPAASPPAPSLVSPVKPPLAPTAPPSGGTEVRPAPATPGAENSATLPASPGSPPPPLASPPPLFSPPARFDFDSSRTPPQSAAPRAPASTVQEPPGASR